MDYPWRKCGDVFNGKDELRRGCLGASPSNKNIVS
jgi:hypothetical protein